MLMNLVSGSSLLLVAGLVFVSASLAGWVLVREMRRAMDEYRRTFVDEADTRLSDMFVFLDPRQLFWFNMISLVVLPLMAWLLTGDLLVALVFAAVLGGLPWLMWRHMRKKRLERIEQQLPDTLMMIAGALKAGASLNVALEGASRDTGPPISQELSLFLREQRIGVDFDDALRHMERRVPLNDFQMVVSALRIAREVGGNLAEILDTLGQTLRRKAAMEGKIESLTAQGKMQGLVMTGLPLLLGLLLMWMEPEAMGKLFTTPAGWATLGVIAVMETLGYLFIRKITTIDV
ncbi:MAG: secretion system protein F [Gammaproteobacteria bacterium]|nr:MAG: secretion system protein F [Gammaproteobacteria bacterium]